MGKPSSLPLQDARNGSQWPAILAVAWAGSNYFVIVSLQPMLLGSLTDNVYFTLGEASLALSANMLGALIGNILAYFLLARVSARTLIVVGAVGMSAFQLTAAVLPITPVHFAVLMLGTGWGTGLMGAAAWATVSVMDRPTRVFAIMGAALVITGAVAIYLAPHVIAAFGLPGLMLGLAVSAALVLPTTPLFFEPGRPDKVQKRTTASNASSRGSVMLLLSLAVLYVANNATWAYLALIAEAAGLVGDQVGSAIAIGQLVSVVGSVLAARFEGSRSRPAIAIALLLLVISTTALMFGHNVVAMTVIVAGIMGAVSFAVPLYLADLVFFDSSGRLVVWGQLAIGIGLMLGPPAASFWVDFTSLNTMIWTAGGVYLLSLALAALAFKLRPITAVPPPNSSLEQPT